MKPVYIINFDGMGDAWYALIVLKNISKILNKKIDVVNYSKPLDDVITRFDFLNVLTIDEAKTQYKQIKLFDMVGAAKLGMHLLNSDTCDFVSKTMFDFSLEDNERDLLYPKIKTRDFKKYDLIFHTAKTWNSRSISEDVWMQLYRHYSEKGLSIAVIGRDIVACDMVKKTLSLPVGDEDDFTNKLSLDETMNLIDNSRILVTGQGGISVLSAGLLNPNIVVAEGCVRKEYRFIYRNGSPYYKTIYVKNPSGIYHEDRITYSVTDDIRQQPTFDDLCAAIDKFLNKL